MNTTEPYYITESKRICRVAGMDPNEVSRPKTLLSDVEFEQKRKSYSEILSVVSFFSNKLLDSLKGTPILVVVSDATGYLLEIEGDETIKSTIEQFGIKPGSLFRQEDTGTNVISLSLQQKHPISIIGEQHFHTFLHSIACYGTAFHYTDDNDLLGSVSIMMPIQFQNELFLTMLSQAVDSIERELLLRKQNKKLNIMNQIMLSRTRNGIVITDEKGITTEFNSFAQEISNLSRESVVGRNILESHITGEYFKEVLEHERIFKNEEIKFKDDADNLIVCLFDAQPIYEEGKMVGAFGQFRDISDRYILQEKYNYLAFHDDLTNLPNRRYINKEIESIIKELNAGHHRTLALLFIDLDRFKIINDNFSHSYGDKLLIEVSKRLSGCLGENDILARMGGDEFIFLLKDFVDVDYVTKKAEEILQLLLQPFLVGGKELHTTASIGVAVYPDYPITMEQLMVYADNAMYQAKSQGKNCYVFHTSELLDALMDDYMLEVDLRSALEKKEFVLHYQPQINNETGELIGFEALIRWQHPTLGQIPPGKFIKLAEENGLITQIGEWVIDEACSQNKKWQDAGMTPVKISINLSTQQFLTRNLITYMEDVLERTAIDPAYVVVEITEYMAMEYEYSIHVLEQLKALGIGISIDDFGTGYSSFNYLKNFPIDYIKIDKSFVSEIMNNDKDAVIIKAIISLAHNLHKEVIAEGVETKEQLEFLKYHKCDISQGYFFSKPLPADEIERIYLEQH
ncbi:PAS domain S-box-containing protein/diguanylate cyclase (GGDEF) domain-containing protein [Psychrobacillus sp. OK028]|uniref:EAL domain-containing protein n=1 Tax=Psychrobacillus sp. OK028 TaxID=1884359 RepID=UPI000891E5D4|nr:EAL domain-containing protein [Psychrobacillus sp. OK028]SDM37879.1 PAS domain S-box-containing protein/diguanylate cyclase (GGDEF) domain-containing protein [Psychrobacillus sp. OK028]